MSGPPQDIPHPLPRRYGTGLPALGALASARARGWDAVAHVLAPVDAAWLTWVLDRSVDDFETALGWRQGEEERFGKDLFALYSWCRARQRRQDGAQQLERLAGVVPAPAETARAASWARGFAEACEAEARAWRTRDVPTARAARARQAVELRRYEAGLSGALRQLPDGYAPVHYLRRLGLTFVDLDTGGATVEHLRSE